LNHTSNNPLRRAVIVGSGFSGALTAARLIDLTDGEVEVVLLEQAPAHDIGGLAYGTAAGWEHLLNIQAGRVSLFREEPNDFLHWANDPSTTRADWPAPPTASTSATG
jgi:uncharacterized NAD(P)/FAD-binding protein YdhS